MIKWTVGKVNSVAEYAGHKVVRIENLFGTVVHIPIDNDIMLPEIGKEIYYYQAQLKHYDNDQNALLEVVMHGVHNNEKNASEKNTEFLESGLLLEERSNFEEAIEKQKQN